MNGRPFLLWLERMHDGNERIALLDPDPMNDNNANNNRTRPNPHVFGLEGPFARAPKRRMLVQGETRPSMHGNSLSAPTSSISYYCCGPSLNIGAAVVKIFLRDHDRGSPSLDCASYQSHESSCQVHGDACIFSAHNNYCT